MVYTVTVLNFAFLLPQLLPVGRFPLGIPPPEEDAPAAARWVWTSDAPLPAD